MRNWIFAISAALCYASSTIFIKKGLIEFDSPLLGATISQIFSALIFGIFLIGSNQFGGMRFKDIFSLNRKSVLLLVIAGTLITAGTMLRWTALSIAPVVIVTPIFGVIPLITVGLSHLMLRSLERVTTRTWIGTGFVVLGSALIAVTSIV